MAVSKTPLTDWLISAGSAAGGGAALGATTMFLAWMVAAPVLRVVGILLGRRYSTTSVAALDKFMLVGAGIGGVCGLVLFMYEHYGLL